MLREISKHLRLTTQNCLHVGGVAVVSFRVVRTSMYFRKKHYFMITVQVGADFEHMQAIFSYDD